MQFSQRAILALSLVGLLLAVPGGSARAQAEDLNPMAKSINEFGLNLYTKLTRPGENLFLSPASISTALAMTYAGARGATAEEMRETLRFSAEDPEETHAAMGRLLRSFSAAHEGYELSVANALWGQQGDHFEEGFIGLTDSHYGAGLRRVDFRGATDSARRTINGWVEEQTRQRIRDLVPPGVLDATTSLVLTNAIYFKGTWLLQFDPQKTIDAPFQLDSGATTEVPLMRLRGSTRFGYFQGDGLQALELPYTGDAVSMVILLPTKGSSLESFEKRLTVDALDGWLSEMRPRELDLVALPRFELTSESRLAKILPQMGMRSAFGGRADFSGMNGKRDLFISEVLHKAFVKVNEEGTEAAAATAVVMKRASFEPKPSFVADHPFLFLIRDRVSGTLLFLGRLASP